MLQTFAYSKAETNLEANGIVRDKLNWKEDYSIVMPKTILYRIWPIYVINRSPAIWPEWLLDMVEAGSQIGVVLSIFRHIDMYLCEEKRVCADIP